KPKEEEETPATHTSGGKRGGRGGRRGGRGGRRKDQTRDSSEQQTTSDETIEKKERKPRKPRNDKPKKPRTMISSAYKSSDDFWEGNITAPEVVNKVEQPQQVVEEK